MRSAVSCPDHVYKGMDGFMMTVRVLQRNFTLDLVFLTDNYWFRMEYLSCRSHFLNKSFDSGIEVEPALLPTISPVIYSDPYSPG